MACYHPLPAWRTQGGSVVLGKEPADSIPLQLPCGGCLGCRTASAKDWALRCQLELQNHESATFTTLTYDNEHQPPTLSKRHLQLFLKRLRKETGPARPIRFFAAGEYGETNLRPHYHAILYGLHEGDKDLVQNVWGLGFTKSVNATPASIAYTAGYCAKKIGWVRETELERINYETGEIYKWQPPFIQMSRQPGIGGTARRHANSWRQYAIHNGAKIRVPRFLHEAWKQQATPEQKEELEYEKYKKSLTRHITKQQLQAQELIQKKHQELKAQKRKL